MQNCLGALLAAGLLTLSIGAAQSADGVPNFDVEPTCRGATRPEAAMRNKDGDAAREACFNQETRARDELKDNWAGFPAEHRTSCVKTTSVGGIPSYVQLQTCLESRRDAARIQDKRDGGTTTTGQGSTPR